MRGLLCFSATYVHGVRRCSARLCAVLLSNLLPNLIPDFLPEFKRVSNREDSDRRHRPYLYLVKL